MRSYEQSLCTPRLWYIRRQGHQHREATGLGQPATAAALQPQVWAAAARRACWQGASPGLALA